MSIQVRSNEKPLSPPPQPAAEQVPSAAGSVVEGEEGKSEGTQPTSAPEGNESSLEQNKSSDSETEEKAETHEEGEDGEKESPHKKKGGFQRRIDKLSAQKAQAQQELEYWKQQALKNAGASNVETNPKPEIFTPPTTEGKPKPESFETHAEYVEALADWKTEQKLKERDEKAARERFAQEEARIKAAYSERAKAFSSKTPDFQKVLEDVNHIPLSLTLRDILLNSENGPELAYHLAKKPEEYERIARLSPTACAREIGKFEATLTSSLSKVSPEKSEKRITQAPKPIEPVGAGGKGSVVKSIFDPGLSQREYEAMRREQMKKRRQAS